MLKDPNPPCSAAICIPKENLLQLLISLPKCFKGVYISGQGIDKENIAVSVMTSVLNVAALKNVKQFILFIQ